MLVETGLITQQNVGRWTTYRLNVSTDEPVRPEPETNDDKVIAYVRERGAITNRECRELLEVKAQRAQYLLTKLVRAGRLKSVDEKKSRRYVFSSTVV